jgi:lysophospholipase L1-like esterase
MRPMPAHFRDLAPASGLLLEIREWAQGGLNTETYPSFYRRLLPEWEGKACDAILFQLGTNDAVPLLEKRWEPVEFRNRMTAILAEFKKYPGRKRPRPIIFLATVPLFCDRPESAAKNRIVETVINPLIRDIARAEGAVLVDNGAVLDHHPALYDPDCVHPGPEGEKALALNWMAALGRAFPDEIAKPPLRPGDRS